MSSPSKYSLYFFFCGKIFPFIIHVHVKSITTFGTQERQLNNAAGNKEIAYLTRGKIWGKKLDFGCLRCRYHIKPIFADRPAAGQGWRIFRVFFPRPRGITPLPPPHAPMYAKSPSLQRRPTRTVSQVCPPQLTSLQLICKAGDGRVVSQHGRLKLLFISFFLLTFCRNSVWMLRAGDMLFLRTTPSSSHLRVLGLQ